MAEAALAQDFDYRADESYRSQRREAIRADLVKRLRHVCAHLADDDFNRLIDVMVERQLRSERGNYR